MESSRVAQCRRPLREDLLAWHRDWPAADSGEAAADEAVDVAAVAERGTCSETPRSTRTASRSAGDIGSTFWLCGCSSSGRRHLLLGSSPLTGSKASFGEAASQLFVAGRQRRQVTPWRCAARTAADAQGPPPAPGPRVAGAVHRAARSAPLA
eukprot:CAMPEP_0176241076 /NCGR_PEP_ID=MMETSP0121_2-20121125/29706_1 /TAXON_ID=160619 /ORGANISM="Kryptoperidinium foliaceum, Strain CCMP 1326" /LENGTH=152 /DNA_ID=CAMNT_0017580595 /DNA_START=45 /DNA_END=501 /DNA_ORIENTATION=-